MGSIFSDVFEKKSMIWVCNRPHLPSGSQVFCLEKNHTYRQLPPKAWRGDVQYSVRQSRSFRSSMFDQTRSYSGVMCEA